MVSPTILILENHVSNPRLGRVIREVMDFVGSSPIVREDGPTPPGIPAKEVSDIHVFRQRSGLYKLASITGLDETIESLRICNSLVQARVIETDRGYVSIWLDEQDVPVGAMIFRKDAAPDATKS
jgi:hypothetical protein